MNQPFRKEELNNANLNYVIGYLFWKSTISVVFAFALYMMFVGGFIAEDLFPNFIKTTVDDGGEYINMKQFFTEVDPVSYKDVAKILVWSFIAGFSERFVPNLISQILEYSKK